MQDAQDSRSIDSSRPTPSRRAVLASAIALGALQPMLAMAQAGAGTSGNTTQWPQKPLRLIVPLAPGGIADVMARMLGEHLQHALGQAVIIDNRPGAGTSIGMAAVAKSPPDGYTIGMGNIAANAIVPALQPDRIAYDPIKDFAPVTLVGSTPIVLEVNPQRIPAKTIPELIAYLKANPGKVSYGSSGQGTSLHIGMELFKIRTGTDMVHVPYKGSAPMLNALLAGEVDMALDAASTSLPHIRGGKLRALGVASPQRAFFAPELPAIAEVVPGFEINPWHGIMAPGGTPPAIVERLDREIQVFLKRPDTVEKFKDRGVVVGGAGPQAFSRLVADDLELYRSVIRKAGITAE